MTTENEQTIIPDGPIKSTPAAAALAAAGGATPEPVDELAAAGAAKLRVLLGGKIPEAKTTAAPAPKPAPELSANEQRIKALNENPALWNPAHPDNARLRKELREAIAAASTDEERQAVADTPLSQLREQFKVDPTRVLPSLRESWDSAAEGTLLATFAQNGVAPEVASEVIEYYIDQFNGAVGKVGNVNAAEMEAGARKIFAKHGVAKDVVDAVIEHEKKRLGLT